MRPVVLLAAVPLLIATPAVARPGPSAISQSDKDFLDFAAKVNQSEIQGDSPRRRRRPPGRSGLRSPYGARSHGA